MGPHKINSEDTRSCIIKEAIKQFGEKGFGGVSVRDICNKIKVNVSAIKYYFGGKDELYRECFKSYGESKLEMAGKFLTKANSLDELKLRLKIFFENFIEDGITNIHKTKMICREIESLNPMIEDIFEDTLLKFYQSLLDIIIDAQKKKIIAKNIDPNVATAVIFHGLTMAIRHDHINEKYFKSTLKNKKYQEHFINQLITITFDGIKSQESK